MSREVTSFYVRTSALDPAGQVASSIFELTSWMTWIFGAVFVLVMVLVIIGVFGKRQEIPPNSEGESKFIVGLGVIFPTVVLTGLLILTLSLTGAIQPTSEEPTIKVTGYMWWWEVSYPQHGIVTANEIYIPVGERIQIEVASVDVIHSLWVPSLAGKMDLIPGLKNRIVFEASEPGVYRGQCAEFCGLAHAQMSLHVVALEPAAYARWLEQKKSAREELSAAPPSAGLEVFKKVGCAECHSIGKLPALGNVGPDLTHVGSRVSLGAGTVLNNKGNLMGWISNPQALKPGNKMPRSFLSSHELHVLSDYLLSLK